MADLLVVRLQALDNTRDAKVVVPLGAVQRPDGAKQTQQHKQYQRVAQPTLQWVITSLVQRQIH